MAPKKGKKIALSEFLGDGSLGSWADEVDALPSAPAPKFDNDSGRDGSFGRRDDSRGDRPGFAREEIPLPTQPPYTAFIGNLAFDISEEDIANHFSEHKLKSVKIIKDRDDRPKGFGYVEFDTLDGLKDALSKSGAHLAGRAVRVSVAEPPKERSGFGGGREGGGFSDEKFDNPWRRDGPLPDLPGRGDRDGPRRRFEGPPGDRPERVPSVTDTVSDWRSTARPVRAPAPEPEPSFKRKGSGFLSGNEGAGDKDDNWSIGGKFKPSTDDAGGRFGSQRQRSEHPPRESPADEGDWRSARRAPRNSGGNSPASESIPSTPQMGRRKLELLPRSGSQSTSQTPLSSPKMASAPAAPKPNPFGAAKPVDVSQREKQVEEKIEKEKESLKERIPMARTGSRPGIERPSAPASPKVAQASVTATVRPTLSFAGAAAAKKASEGESAE